MPKKPTLATGALDTIHRKLSKGELSKRRILEAALKEFAKHGYDLTSIQTIADRAGAQKTAITHYFGDKLGLFRECVEEILVYHARMLEADTDEKDDAYRRLQKSFLGNLQLNREKPDYVRLLIALYSFATHEPGLNKLYREVVSRVRARYEGLILAGIRERQFGPKLEPVMIAELFHEVIIGSMIDFVAFGASKELEARVREKWKELVVQLLKVDSPTPSLF